MSEKNPVVLKDTSYENNYDIEFLPGHRVLLLNLPNEIEVMKNVNKNIPELKNKQDNWSQFSFMLKALIETKYLDFSVRVFLFSEHYLQ